MSRVSGGESNSQVVVRKRTGRRPVWLFFVLLPFALFGSLWVLRDRLWQPGAPGLASGKVALQVDRSLTIQHPSMAVDGRSLSGVTVRYSWHEGAKLHVDIVAQGRVAQGTGEFRATLILTRGLIGTIHATAIAHWPTRALRPGRVPLSGTVTLTRPGYRVIDPPRGAFRFVLAPSDAAPRTVSGTFRPAAH